MLFIIIKLGFLGIPPLGVEKGIDRRRFFLKLCTLVPPVKQMSTFFGARERLLITPSALCGVEGSIRLLLTKNSTRSFSCSSCQIPQPWLAKGD